MRNRTNKYMESYSVRIQAHDNFLRQDAYQGFVTMCVLSVCSLGGSTGGEYGQKLVWGAAKKLGGWYFWSWRRGGWKRWCVIPSYCLVTVCTEAPKMCWKNLEYKFLPFYENQMWSRALDFFLPFWETQLGAIYLMLCPKGSNWTTSLNQPPTLPILLLDLNPERVFWLEDFCR